jgi:hypothetical protein
MKQIEEQDKRCMQAGFVQLSAACFMHALQGI